MIIDHEALMQWAKSVSPDRADVFPREPRPIRLEIGYSDHWTDTAGIRYRALVARVYLRDPRCNHSDVDLSRKYDCECGAIAEKRLA
jgi:hypothetical protein